MVSRSHLKIDLNLHKDQCLKRLRNQTRPLVPRGGRKRLSETNGHPMLNVSLLTTHQIHRKSFSLGEIQAKSLVPKHLPLLGDVICKSHGRSIWFSHTQWVQTLYGPESLRLTWYLRVLLVEDLVSTMVCPKFSLNNCTFLTGSHSLLTFFVVAMPGPTPMWTWVWVRGENPARAFGRVPCL